MCWACSMRTMHTWCQNAGTARWSHAGGRGMPLLKSLPMWKSLPTLTRTACCGAWAPVHPTGAAACKRPLTPKKKIAYCYSLARLIRSYDLLLVSGSVLAQACMLLPAGQAGRRTCTSPGSASPPSCSARLRSFSTPAAPSRRDSQQCSAAVHNMGVKTWECSLAHVLGLQHTSSVLRFLLSKA